MNTELKEINKMVKRSLELCRRSRTYESYNEENIELILEALNQNGLPQIGMFYHLGMLVLIQDEARLAAEDPDCECCNNCDNCECKGDNDADAER